MSKFFNSERVYKLLEISLSKLYDKFNLFRFLQFPICEGIESILLLFKSNILKSFGKIKFSVVVNSLWLKFKYRNDSRCEKSIEASLMLFE